MNTFTALNIFYREDVISDFLKNCFEDSPVFLQQFLQSAQLSIPITHDVKIYNRKGLGKHIGTPDMVIVVKDSENHVVIVENKLGAAEGDTQTERYYTDAARKAVNDQFKLDENITHFHFIYLTLDTTVTPREKRYTQVFYKQFLHGEWPLKDATLNIIFRDFQLALQQFYAPLENPQQTLSTNLKLDQTQTKICWQLILFEQFRNDPQFWVDWGNVGGIGRNNFLFLISKPNWWSNRYYTETGLAKTYYIHIDTYIDLLTDQQQYVREIGVRYETHPYKPKKQIEHLEGYDVFRHNKHEFAQRLFEKVQQFNINAKKTGYDLLVLTVPINASSWQQSVEVYSAIVKQLEVIIDEVVVELGLLG
ncbi:PD-(D/E)XK nuclease family protein [Solibacillus silvestris]